MKHHHEYYIYSYIDRGLHKKAEYGNLHEEMLCKDCGKAAGRWGGTHSTITQHIHDPDIFNGLVSIIHAVQ